MFTGIENVFLPAAAKESKIAYRGNRISSRAIEGNQAKVLDATELLSCNVN